MGVDIVEIADAKSILQYLHRDDEILIATNGPTKSANEKLVKAELSSYVNNLVSSKEVGFSKPSAGFFNFLFNKTSNKEKDKILLIGDSLTTDILGGMNNGIDTC